MPNQLIEESIDTVNDFMKYQKKTFCARGLYVL